MPVGGLIEGCEWRSHAFDWLCERYRRMLPAAELVFGTSDAEPYNRAEARHNAFTASGGDILVIIDADTILPHGEMVRAISSVRAGLIPWSIPYETYINLTDKASFYLLKNYEAHPDVPEVPLPPPEIPGTIEHTIECSPAGAWVLTREAYEKVGGFDERFVGWGGDDDAFVAAMDTLIGEHRRGRGFAMHLWHPRGDADFGHAHWDANAALLRRYRRARGSEAQMRQLVAEHSHA